MANRRIYKKAPITEAVLAISIDDLGNLEKLQPARDRLLAAYPVEHARHELRAELNVGKDAGDQVPPKSRQVAYLLKNPEAGKIVRLKHDDFAFSKLAPYTRWEELREDAKQAWAIFKAAAQPIKVKRLALRYINRIDVPGTNIRTEDYILTGPVIPKGLPQQIHDFKAQVVLPADDIGGAITITTALVEPAVKDSVSLLLDIDVFSVHDIPEDDAEMWARFEQMQVRKNEVFEASITEKARELFD